MVGGERCIGAVAEPGEHVEVGNGGLDHQHVGALLEVGERLAHRLAAVGRIHLVPAPVALRRGRAGGLAEGAVEGGGVLDRVGEDRRRAQALAVEGGADRGDAPVHHVAGSDGVGAGLRLRERGAGDQLERGVVVDVAVAEHAAVAVGGVLAEAGVGDHDEVGVRLLQRPDRHLHDALVVVGAGAGLVLVRRDPEQDHRRHAGGVRPRRPPRPGPRSRAARRRASRRPARPAPPPRARTAAGSGRRGAASSRGPSRAARRSGAGGAAWLRERPWPQSRKRAAPRGGREVGRSERGEPPDQSAQCPRQGPPFDSGDLARRSADAFAASGPPRTPIEICAAIGRCDEPRAR